MTTVNGIVTFFDGRCRCERTIYRYVPMRKGNRIPERPKVFRQCAACTALEWARKGASKGGSG